MRKSIQYRLRTTNGPFHFPRSLSGLGVVGAIITCLFLVFGYSPVYAADWPRFLGPAGTGISHETGLIDTIPETGPEAVWKKSIGTGYSAPSIKGDKLILHHRVANEEVVECFKKSSGESIWRYAYPSDFIDPYGYNNGPRSSPWIDDERVYLVGAEGVLSCLNLSDGKLIWQRNYLKEWDVPEAFFGVGSSPIIVDGVLIVMVGGQPDSGMVGLDPVTGKTLWESVGRATWDGVTKTGWQGEPIMNWTGREKQASYATPVVASFNGEKSLLCLMRQGLVSLDPKSGDVQFHRWFRARVNESVNAACPVVVDQSVFISGAYYRVGSVLLDIADNGKSYEENWRGLALEMHWSTPVYVDGYLYGFSGRNESDASLRCIEYGSGRLMWERDESWRRFTRTPDKFGRGSFILAEGKFFTLGEGGMLGIFRPNPDKVEEISRWQVPELQYPCWTAPILSDGLLYLRSENRLICFDIKKTSGI